MSDLVCSFTGHRSIEERHKPYIHALLLRAVEYAYNEGCRAFCAGGALGFDTEAARAVIEFRISHPDARLILVLPCPEQDAYWSNAQRDSYSFILKNANEVIYTADGYFDGCMRVRNQRLADECHILIAYASSRTKSGASQTVRMAERLSRRIYNLYPTLEKTASDN